MKYSTQECEKRANKARKQFETMSCLNSSKDERELTQAAIRTWSERAAYAVKHGGYWEYEYEPM